MGEQLALDFSPARSTSSARPAGKVHYFTGRTTETDGVRHQLTACGWCTGPEHADRRTRRRCRVTCRVCLRRLEQGTTNEGSR